MAWDHLHIRGEYANKDQDNEIAVGSPPHTWRIPKQETPVAGEQRITSTYVENTYVFRSWLPMAWDHLHIRGEYANKDQDNEIAVGSPPHTWRILEAADSVELRLRITSTYVENTFYSSLFCYLWRDHLHIRGEYATATKTQKGLLGSPPHTWRILTSMLDDYGVDRITSTYVENTLVALITSTAM